MSDEEIIKLWKTGYTVKQIVEKHPLKKKLKDDWIIWYRVERVIMNYYKKGGEK